MLEQLAKILQYIKQDARIVFGIFLSAACLLLVNENLTQSQTWRPYLWVAFIISSCFLVSHIVFDGVPWLYRRREKRLAEEDAARKEAARAIEQERRLKEERAEAERREREAKLEQQRQEEALRLARQRQDEEAKASIERDRDRLLSKLGDDERELLGIFLQRRERTITLSMIGPRIGTANALVSRSILYQPGGFVAATNIPFTIQEWAWDRILSNPAIVKMPDDD